MIRTPSRWLAAVSYWLACVALALLVCHPDVARAQGFPGGMSGGMGGRGGNRGARGGGRGNRGDEPRDSSSGARRDDAGTIADLALQHRSELQLTDSQTTVVAYIARQARVDRINAAAALASLQDTTGETAPATVLNDSTRRALLDHRRAVAAAFARLHDVDVNARSATLAVLSEAQQATLVKLESSGSAADGERGGRGGGRPRG